MNETIYRGYRIRTGEKYDPDLDVKEIARRIRHDLADARRRGALPSGLQTTVRIDRYSGGCSLDIVVRGLPADAPPDTWKYSNYARGIVDLLRPFYEAYQRTEDDCPGDYHHSNFLGFVRWEVKLS